MNPLFAVKAFDYSIWNHLRRQNILSKNTAGSQYVASFYVIQFSFVVCMKEILALLTQSASEKWQYGEHQKQSKLNAFCIYFLVEGQLYCGLPGWRRN